MRKINAGELVKIFKEHKRWCDTEEEEGEKADLSDANLRGANLIRTVEKHMRHDVFLVHQKSFMGCFQS